MTIEANHPELNKLIEKNLEIGFIHSLGWNGTDLLSFEPNEYQNYILDNLKPFTIVWKGRGIGSTSILLAHMLYLRIKGSLFECVVVAPTNRHRIFYESVLKNFASPRLNPLVLSISSTRILSLNWADIKHIMFADIDQWSLENENPAIDISAMGLSSKIESVIVESDVSREETLSSSPPIWDERMSEIYVTSSRCAAKSKGQSITTEVGRPSITDEFVRKIIW